jgi:thiol-disulfide isomerase/thioredoxin
MTEYMQSLILSSISRFNMHLYILLGVLVLILVVFKLYGTTILGFQNQGPVMAGQDTLIIVKADWCGHCKKAMPDFEQLVNASPITKADGSAVTVRLLDSDADSSEVKNLNVKGFPTILYQSADGTVSNYNGERSYNAIQAFLMQQ